jgi:hypothetical protein
MRTLVLKNEGNIISMFYRERGTTHRLGCPSCEQFILKNETLESIITEIEKMGVEYETKHTDNPIALFESLTQELTEEEHEVIDFLIKERRQE